MTLDRIDQYIILAFGVLFIGLAILFSTTWYISRILMKGKVRTRLSAAQHALFFGLAVIGSAMGPAFILSYFSGTGRTEPSLHIEPYWITIGIRVVLLTGLVIVSVAGARSFIAQYKRYRGIDDDPDDVALEQTNVRQDVREVEQNVREVFQDERAVIQDQRSVVQDQRQVTADERSHDQDARDVVATDRDTLADEREKQAGEP